MGEIKTKPNDASVVEFIETTATGQKRQDALVLLEMFTRITGLEAKMWGTSIVGFGQYHYTSERSSQEGDWPLAGFSPRKQNLTLYVMTGTNNLDSLLTNLGKHKTSVGCLYINKLADVDMNVLEKIITKAYSDAVSRYT